MTGGSAVPAVRDGDAVGDVMGDLQTVEKVVRYQSGAADRSVILNEGVEEVNEVRMAYLRNLRDDWAWVDASDVGRRYVLLKRRD